MPTNREATQELRPVCALIYFVHPAVFDRQDAIRLLGEAIVVGNHDKSDPLFSIHLAHDAEDKSTII